MLLTHRQGTRDPRHRLLGVPGTASACHAANGLASLAAMKTVVLLFHPHRERSRVNAALAQAAADAGVEVRDEYALYPDFRIDVAAEQAAVAEADRIVWLFPMYWYSSPALLKQWEDDVLAYGWAYGSTGTALARKELMIAVSPGADASKYTREGAYTYLVPELLRPFQATSNLISTTFVEPFITAGATTISEATIAALFSAGLYPQLESHLRMGKAHGITKAEAVEVVTQLAFYCGWPKAWSTFPLIEKVWAEEDAIPAASE